MTPTDPSGNYFFPLVAPGIYTLRTEAPGFRTYEVTSASRYRWGRR